MPSAVVRQEQDPAIQTLRLTLRPHATEDFHHSLSLWSDPEVTRFIGGRPATEEDVWARVLRYIGHWHALGFGYWAIFERSSGRFVGETGFADFHRNIDPPLWGMPEMGWALAPWAHGSGFASEAVMAALDWGDRAFTAPACCIISPENTSSLRVAAKAGFKEVAATRYHDAPTLVFRREAPQ